MRTNGARQSNQEIIEVVTAYENGCTIEVGERVLQEVEWRVINTPGFNFAEYKYRIAEPKNETANQTFLQKLFKKNVKEPKIHDAATLLTLFYRGILSREDLLKRLDLTNKKYCFHEYLQFFESRLISKTELISYIKDLDIEEHEYINLYDTDVITKEELIEALEI